MIRPLRILTVMSRWERWTLGVLAALAVLSAALLVRQFYVDETTVMPAAGGTYIEGSVGNLQPLNPWFTVQNDVNRDIVSLVFAGLLRYNPQTRAIEDDLATMQVSPDGKTYTLTLKDNIFWHDSTPQNPHPVTADDVLFTFTSVQDPGFPNQILQQNFRGVHISKVDDRTVRFVLDEPYSFFPSNLTLGLVPKSAFDGIPVSKFDQNLDFAYHPIGAGPYKFKTIIQTDLSTEVTLERFPRSIPPVYRLDRVVFRIFPDYNTLMSDVHNLQGIRLVARKDNGDPIVPGSFVLRSYYLPQYVALFFNMSRPNLQDQKLRLGLQLGTDKKAIVDAIHESIIVDTPLLELNMGDWHYQFDPNAAQGALLASKWNVPERVRLQKLLEYEDANNAGPLRTAPIALLQPATVLTVTGSYADVPRGSKLNGWPVLDLPTASGAWMVNLPVLHGTGAVSMGENLLRLADPKGKTLDSFYLVGAKDAKEYAELSAERQLARLFVQSKGDTAPTAAHLTINNLILENGILRLRSPSDPPSVRVNEKGEPLVLHLLTSSAPPAYKKVAEEVQKEWKTLGVQVVIDIPATRDAFQDKLLRRDYDVVLFGQSLLDNLDSYPYWHSSGVQKLTGNDADLRSDAYNLSQYASFKADSLLETIRKTNDEKERQQALGGLRDVLKADVPAIFLYSPLYMFAQQRGVQGVDLGSLSLHSDRFLTIYKWYIKQGRVFKTGENWMSFFPWLGHLL